MLYANLAKAFPRALFNNIPEEMLKQSDALLGASKSFMDASKDLNASALSYQQVKNLIDRGNDAQRLEDLTARFNVHAQKSQIGPDAFKAQNGENFFDEIASLVGQGGEEFFRRGATDFENSFIVPDQTESLLNTKKLNALFYNSRIAEKTFGLTQKDVFKAIKGDFSSAPENVDFLKLLSKNVQTMDKNFLTTFKDVANVGELRDYVLPLNFLSERVAQMSVEDISSLFVKHTTMTEGGIEAVAKNIKKAAQEVLKDDLPKGTHTVSGVRNLKFKSLDDEFEFFNAIYGGFEDSNTLLNNLYRQKQNLSIKSFLYKEFGTNPLKTVQKILGKEDLPKFKQKIDFLTGKNFYKDSTIKVYTDALDKFTSAIYGAPKSIIRQIAVDVFGHNRAIKDFFINQSPIGEFFQEVVYRPLQGMFKSAGQNIRGNNAIRNELNKMLSVMGFSSSNSLLFKSIGFSGENVLSLAQQGKGKAYQIGQRLSDMAGSLNNKMHEITGNMFYYDAVKTNHLIKNATWFTEFTLKAGDYNHFKKTMGVKYRYFEDFFNLGEREFEALRNVKTMKFKMNKNNKYFGVNKDLELITYEGILNMDDKIANQFKKRGETAKVFKQRLATNYYQMLADQAQKGQANVGTFNTIMEKFVKRGTLLDMFLRPTLLKFGNITHVQYQNLKKAIGIMNYGSPFDGNEVLALTNGKTLQSWLSAYGWYFMTAMAMVQFKDLLAGRTPRLMSVEDMLRTEIDSGVFGMPVMAMTQLMEMLQGEGQDYVPVSLAKTIKKAPESSYNFLDSARKLSGVGNTWWNSGVLDNLLRQTLQDSGDRAKINHWYQNEIGTKYFLD